jgi:hypothetical protein
MRRWLHYFWCCVCVEARELHQRIFDRKWDGVIFTQTGEFDAQQNPKTKASDGSSSEGPQGGQEARDTAEGGPRVSRGGQGEVEEEMKLDTRPQERLNAASRRFMRLLSELKEDVASGTDVVDFNKIKAAWRWVEAWGRKVDKEGDSNAP